MIGGAAKSIFAPVGDSLIEKVNEYFHMSRETARRLVTTILVVGSVWTVNKNETRE